MSESETEAESAALVRRALDAFNRGDGERFLGYFAEDMRFWMNGSHGFSGAVLGKSGFVELVGRVAAGLSEMITLEVDNFIAAGEWVVVESRGHATTTSGASYDNHYCMLWRVHDGRIVELKEYNDSALVMASFPR